MPNLTNQLNHPSKGFLIANNITSKIDKLEEDFRKNDSHNLFKTVRELEELPKKSLNIVKDANGVKQTDPESVMDL